MFINSAVLLMLFLKELIANELLILILWLIFKESAVEPEYQTLLFYFSVYVFSSLLPLTFTVQVTHEKRALDSNRSKRAVRKKCFAMRK